MNLWLQFIFFSAVIFFFARGLVDSSEKIASIRGWGGLWAGFLLLSLATTLPELFGSLSASAVFQAPDLSVGNILGSVIFNLFIIAILDILQGPGPITRQADIRLILLGGIGLMLGAVLGIGIMAGLWRGLGVSPFSVLLAAGYLAGSRLVFVAGPRPPRPSPGGIDAGPERVYWLKYIICAACILAASVFLVRAVDGIALATGLGRTFAGTLFLAAATSLPEASATVAAVRRGSYDMALGNILGANTLNFAVVFLADCFYPGGNLLAGASPGHAVTALIGILMTGAVIIGIIYRSKKSFGFMGWDSVIIAASYFVGGYILFGLR